MTSVAKSMAIVGGGAAFVMFVGSLVYQTATGGASPVFDYFMIGFLAICVIGTIKWALELV